jgi:peptide/nickel transport system permease protein
MLEYILRRIGLLLLTLLIASFMVFLISQVIPGDVCRVILGREAGDAALQTCRVDLGYVNEDGESISAVHRYISWLTNFSKGDWGRSFATGEDIKTWVTGRLNNSLMLAGLVLVISVPLATFLGILAGLNEGKWIDTIISIGSLSVVGLPEFVTSILLINLVAFRSDIIPATSSIPIGSSFWEALPSLILPATATSLVLLAYIARLTRAGVIQELKQNYVRTAELKGLKRSTVLFKHVLRNSLLPTITVIAISIGWLISGLVVVENVFNFPGLGRLMIFAIDRRDLPTLQACVMVAVVGFALANLAADLIYTLLNPRIRSGN